MAATRRRSVLATAVTGLVLSAALTTTGCDAVGKALDCVQTADSIADSVTALQQAAENASNDPAALERSLDSIDRDLTEIGDSTDDVDVEEAVDHLGTAVDNIRTAVRDGDRTPDLTPVTSAAGELTKVCTP
ncbi:hypothetical protein ACGFZL_20660 [Streptomyces sp. NPDC048182]|uniref:hypothetical protein n=1 Tax=Streptomyces sp. NPDC048182 TaxID=3365507 RepID=UPI003721197A